MKNRMMAAASTIACVATMASCASAPASSGRVAEASAALRSAGGEDRGTVTMWQDRDNIVHVDIRVTGMPPGPHAIHFHEAGVCNASGNTPFSTAGSHFNPLGRQHGLDNPAGPHAGDAPNFTVAADGSAHHTFTTDRVSLLEGSTSLFDANGTSIVVHAGADDQISQPSGNAGGRIACGVVSR